MRICWGEGREDGGRVIVVSPGVLCEVGQVDWFFSALLFQRKGEGCCVLDLPFAPWGI